MTALITLTSAGVDVGPFDLYGDLDGYTTAFETGITRNQLLAGYTSVVVPDFTNIIRVKSEGDCINFVDIVVAYPPTTTTTTSTTTIAPVTTTTTSTVAPSTTTTTTVASTCTSYVLSNNSGSDQNYSYTPCGGGGTVNDFLGGFETSSSICAENGTMTFDPSITAVESPC